MSLTTPQMIPQPWASASDADKDVIPTTTTVEGRASWSQGFPPETADPLAVGGIPPNRLDFQGVLNALSEHTYYQQSGSVYPWNSSLDYLKGSHVLGSDGVEYICQLSHTSAYPKDPTTDTIRTKWKPMNEVVGDMIYPVGSIYLSMDSVNPGAKFGGTWKSIASGRFLIGVSSTYAAEKTGGSSTHTITSSEMPTHSHNATASSIGAHTHGTNGTITTTGAGGHTHTLTISEAGTHNHGRITTSSDGGHTPSGTVSGSGNHNHTKTIATSSVDAHTHTRGTMDITGGGLWWENPNYDDNANQVTGAFFVNKNIENALGSSKSDHDNREVDFKASRSWTGATSAAGKHTHTITIPDSGTHTHTFAGTAIADHAHTVTVGNAGSHTHNLTVDTKANHTHSIAVPYAGGHTHTVTIDNAGGNAAMSIIPPYLACYMWQRTA